MHRVDASKGTDERARGLDVVSAVEWMRRVHAETAFDFTLGTLVHLRRGGRTGRVMATLGTVLDLQPVIAVDQAVGAHATAPRAHPYRAGAFRGLS